MSDAITLSGSQYTVTGTVRDQTNNQGVVGLDVIVYDKDLVTSDDFLALGVTDPDGTFTVSFEAGTFLTSKPDLYFVVSDNGTELLNTRDSPINNADTDTPPIDLTVDMSGDTLRQLINPAAVPGWKGGFEASNPDFAYPNPDLTSLPMLGNLDNIDKLQRQQKVLWPEFSWLTDPSDPKDPKRCYQMFAPDISRLGYTDDGRVYAIICPQQGACSPEIGCMNVEVTVTGNRGWANEDDKTLAGDMSVIGQIWFSPSAHQNPFVKRVWDHFAANNLPFPSDKAHAIQVTTHNPGQPDQVIFPLRKGESTDFPIPDFARHPHLAWTVGHLGVQIGPIVKTGIKIVDEFNQLIMDIFNLASGNMLQNGNVLTWNVWFTAPDHVDQQEWADHAEKWRQSIDADHGSPEGEGRIARYYDGSPFKAGKALISRELEDNPITRDIKSAEDGLESVERDVADAGRQLFSTERQRLDAFIDKYLPKND